MVWQRTYLTHGNKVELEEEVKKLKLENQAHKEKIQQLEDSIKQNLEEHAEEKKNIEVKLEKEWKKGYDQGTSDTHEKFDEPINELRQ